MIILGFAFLSGLVTILTPCIWPLLPIILSSSIGNRGKSKPLGIALGIMISFAFFTLTISTLVRVFSFDPNGLRLAAVIVIAFLGLSMLIPWMSMKTELMITWLSSRWQPKGLEKRTGFTGGLLTGLALGVIWSPCAGPILATIAALSAMGQVSAMVIAMTLAYVIGVGIPLFAFAYGGQWIVTKTRFLSTRIGMLQKVFGMLMILVAIMIYTNYDKYLQAKILNYFPGIDRALTSFERGSDVSQGLSALRGEDAVKYDLLAKGIFNANEQAREIIGITAWHNSEPLKIADLRGKVVLVDFWTYTCINCIRTFPYLKSWHEKYKDQGLVIIGVHTPEFEFEKSFDNVREAIERYDIEYPVAQDNDYRTWNNYQNIYWPAEYLIDANGIIRRTHFGEGDYQQTEEAIQILLEESGKKVNLELEAEVNGSPRVRISPETYLGNQRMEYYYPTGRLSLGSGEFKLEEDPPRNRFSLGGNWRIESERAVAGTEAELSDTFYANKVFLVMRPGVGGEKVVRVYLDGEFVKELVVDSDKLYELIELEGEVSEHMLKLELEEGIELFAFTFG